MEPFAGLERVANRLRDYEDKSMHGRKAIEIGRLPARAALLEAALSEEEELATTQSHGYDPYNSSGQFLLLESEAVEPAAS